jgi:hypothetical protein
VTAIITVAHVAYGSASVGAEVATERGEVEGNSLEKLIRKRAGLIQVKQDSKRLVLGPAINCEVLVQSQNIRGFKFVRQANQAGVGKIDLAIPVFSQNLLYTGGFLG